jgi:hypothetical protein
LTGTLRDSSGAVVPNATVAVTSIGTAQVRTTTTSADGTYKIGLLPPGNYSLKFEAAGFNTVEVASVTVVVTETAVLDQTVQVGAQTQQVEVRAEAEAVQTASSTVGNVVSSQTMTAMPLDFAQLHQPVGTRRGRQCRVFNAANLGRGSQDIAVNGSTIAQNNYSMDGASIVNFTTNGNTADGGSNPGIGIVNPDAIEEFKIQTSMFDAGYGRKPGANVNVVTKSGTNAVPRHRFRVFPQHRAQRQRFLPQDQSGGWGSGGKRTPGAQSEPVWWRIRRPGEKRQALFLCVLSGDPARRTGFRRPAIRLRRWSAYRPVRAPLLRSKSALGSAFCPGGSATGSNGNQRGSGGLQWIKHQSGGSQSSAS